MCRNRPNPEAPCFSNFPSTSKKLVTCKWLNPLNPKLMHIGPKITFWLYLSHENTFCQQNVFITYSILHIHSLQAPGWTVIQVSTLLYGNNVIRNSFAKNVNFMFPLFLGRLATVRTWKIGIFLNIPNRWEVLLNSANIQYTHTQFCSRIPTLKSASTATKTHSREWQRQVWSGCESRGSTEKCAVWFDYTHAELKNTNYWIQNLLQSSVTVRTLLSLRQQLLTDGFS